MIERKINERFIDGHTQLQCVAADDFIHCHKCYYCDVSGMCNCNRANAGNCFATFRNDDTNVMFIVVE